MRTLFVVAFSIALVLAGCASSGSGRINPAAAAFLLSQPKTAPPTFQSTPRPRQQFCTMRQVGNLQQMVCY